MEVILDVVVISLVGCLSIFGVAHLWAYLESVPTGQDRTDFFHTQDGLRLAVHRYIPKQTIKGKPVILCHGLAGNRYIFDMKPAPSLAEYLRSRGHDVWVAELRGSGLSESPRVLVSESSLGWGFDDHLDYDLDAVINHVTEQTRQDSAHWVGHSMGGMLIETYLFRNQSSKISSAVAVGSPVDFSKMNSPSLKRLLKMKWILRLFPFNPLIPLVKCFMPLSRVGPNILSGFFCSENIDWRVARKFMALGIEFISSSVLWLDMARFVENGEFADRSGKLYSQGVKQSETPLLVICGSKDNIAPTSAALAVCESRKDCQVTETLTFAKGNGCLEDYGHLDLLVGTRVEKEVFPAIHRWLKRWDATLERPVKKK
ncbi:MAG: alpha/beta fold hydrolase [Pseudomonadota bacterium]